MGEACPPHSGQWPGFRGLHLRDRWVASGLTLEDNIITGEDNDAFRGLLHQLRRLQHWGGGGGVMWGPP